MTIGIHNFLWRYIAYSRIYREWIEIVLPSYLLVYRFIDIMIIGASNEYNPSNVR